MEVNWNAVSAISTLVASIGGLVYVGLTYKLWRTADKAYKAANRPILGLNDLPPIYSKTLATAPSDLVLAFELLNFGTTLAEGITASFEIRITGEVTAEYTTAPSLISPVAPQQKFSLTHSVNADVIPYLWANGNEALIVIRLKYRGLEGTFYESFDIWAFDSRRDYDLHRIQVELPKGTFRRG
jgi:hypothetical protein